MPKKAIIKKEKKTKKEEAPKKPKSAGKTVGFKVKVEKVAKRATKVEAKTRQEVKKTIKDDATRAEKVAEKTKPKKRTRTSNRDTGSVDFQIANFTSKIASLAKHLKIHPHDFDSRRGLLIMVGKRRRLLNYVKKNDTEKYEKLSKTLKLKI